MKNNVFFENDIKCQKFIMETMKYNLLAERCPMLQNFSTKPWKLTVSICGGGMDLTKANKY
jgi:hypothetical protein